MVVVDGDAGEGGGGVVGVDSAGGEEVLGDLELGAVEAEGGVAWRAGRRGSSESRAGLKDSPAGWAWAKARPWSKERGEQEWYGDDGFILASSLFRHGF